MDKPLSKEIEGESAAENTAFTLRTIKDILAEEGQEGLLLKSDHTVPPQQPAQPVKPAAMPQAHAPLQTPAHVAPQAQMLQQPQVRPQPQMPQVPQEDPDTIGKRLTARLFGRK